MSNNFSADFMHNEAIVKELDAFAEEVAKYFSTKTMDELMNINVFDGLETLIEETRSRVREINSSFDCGVFIGSFMTQMVSTSMTEAYEKLTD